MASLSGARTAPAGLLRQLRLPILDTYVLQELIWPFVFAFLLFFLFWGFNIFFLAAKYILTENAPGFLVLRFIVFRIPQSIPMAFPFAVLFATLLALGRLMADNEINALRTSGVSLWRIAVTPLLFGICALVLAWTTNEYIAPKSVDLSTRTFYQIIYHTSSLPIETQVFRKDPDTGDVFFVSNLSPDGKVMEGVQIFKPGRNGYWNETIQAPTARVQGGTLLLKDAIVTFYDSQGYMTSQATKSAITIGLPLGQSAAQFMSSENSDAFTMNTAQLSHQVSTLKAQGVGGEALSNMELNLANKLALPFACLTAVLIALPLALKFGKKGRMVGFVLSIVMFFIYYLMLEAASALGSAGRVDPFFAAWFPNIVFAISGLALLWSEEH